MFLKHKTAPLLLTVFFFIANALTAQNGILIGKIFNESGNTIVDAKITFAGQSTEFLSDLEGSFQIKLAPQKTFFSIEAKGYASIFDSADIVTDENTYKTFVLEKMDAMGNVKIQGKRKVQGGTVAGAIQIQRMNIQNSNVISAEDFVKTTIRTTSDALKKIPGATISEGKFVNVRGMFDRYNAGYLNGAPLPSTESDRKAFSFDIIPASLLDNIVVLKSGTPDLIGDFGGGIIKINTKSIPEKFTQSISFGAMYNTITTGKATSTFSTAGSEYFGIVSSDNRIPNNIDPRMHIDYVNAPVNVATTKKFNSNWNMSPYSAAPSPRFNYTVGVPFKIANKQAGMMLSWNYSMTQKFSYANIDSRDFSDNRMVRQFMDSTFSTNVQNGGIANFAIKLNNKNKIDFKNLYSLTYDQNSILRNGMASIDDNIRTQGYSNFVNTNRLYSTQLIGSHALGKKESNLNWVINYGSTKRQVPDFRIAQYSISENDINTRMLSFNPFFRDGSGRFFSNLNENTMSNSVDYSKTWNVKKLSITLKTGLFIQHRSRDFASRQFIYGPLTTVLTSQKTPLVDLASNKISETGLFLIEKTGDKDDYTATSNLKAGYIMFENRMPLFKTNGKNYDIKLVYGVRYEQFNQFLKNKANSVAVFQRYLAFSPTNKDFLPSITSIIPITAKSSIRTSYYKTLNRPEFRELAPFAFYNFSINSEVKGYEKLKRATLNNFDIRYEFYSNKEDMLSFGFFSKTIHSPIEYTLDPTQVQIRTFVYQNKELAQNRGIEFEMRKNLGSFTKYLGSRWLKNFTFYGNFALIQSKVTLDSANFRSLQGQSPYVVNASLFYQATNGWQFNANFNKIGPRIAYIGLPISVAKFGLDIYEFGRSVLDVQIAKSFGKTKNNMVRLTLGDLLAQKTIFYQDMNHNGKYDSKSVLNAGDNTLISFTNGRTANISYSFTF